MREIRLGVCSGTGREEGHRQKEANENKIKKEGTRGFFWFCLFFSKRIVTVLSRSCSGHKYTAG